MRAPDREFILSPTRTPLRKIRNLTLAAAGPAVVAAAIVSAAPVAAPVVGTASTSASPAPAVVRLAAATQAARTASADITAATRARRIARKMLRHYGWWHPQYKPLNKLWTLESGWNRYASNPYSGAYGIPQALPGSKMASAGPDWQTDAATQIRWGLGYIRSVYGSPCGAWSHEQAYGWY